MQNNGCRQHSQSNETSEAAQQGTGSLRPVVGRGPTPSYRYFTNSSCEFYPCHKLDSSALNCLFCYCPLYSGDCPGEAAYVSIKGRDVKDCSGCEFPHLRENYDDMILCLKERIGA